MAIAVDASSPVRWSASLAAGGTMDSASFTAPADSFLVLVINCDGNNDSNYTNGTSTPTVSLSTGTALTWTKRVERTWSETTAGGQSVIWTAPAVTSEARVVRITKDAASVSTLRTAAKLYVLTGVDISGTPVDSVTASNEGGTNTDPTNTTSLTPGANGLLIVAATDWSQTGAITSSNLTVESGDYAGAITASSGYRTCTSGVAVGGNLNPPATPQFKWCQLIVREAAGGGGGSRPKFLGLMGCGI